MIQPKIASAASVFYIYIVIVAIIKYMVLNLEHLEPSKAIKKWTPGVFFVHFFWYSDSTIRKALQRMMLFKHDKILMFRCMFNDLICCLVLLCFVLWLHTFRWNCFHIRSCCWIFDTGVAGALAVLPVGALSRCRGDVNKTLHQCLNHLWLAIWFTHWHSPSKTQRLRVQRLKGRWSRSLVSTGRSQDCSRTTTSGK